ncbi:hypothetical protein ADK84_13250, partial [Streptomyces sp. NRRL WC-3701]
MSGLLEPRVARLGVAGWSRLAVLRFGVAGLSRPVMPGLRLAGLSQLAVPELVVAGLSGPGLPRFGVPELGVALSRLGLGGGVLLRRWCWGWGRCSV